MLQINWLSFVEIQSSIQSSPTVVNWDVPILAVPLHQYTGNIVRDGGFYAECVSLFQWKDIAIKTAMS